MMTIKELHNEKDRLGEKNRELKIEIQLITAWIKEHRESRPARIEPPSPGSDERSEYRSWRKVSCRLHLRRSELKTIQEKTRAQIRAVARRIEEMETGIFEFPVFADTPLESDLASADACA